MGALHCRMCCTAKPRCVVHKHNVCTLCSPMQQPMVRASHRGHSLFDCPYCVVSCCVIIDELSCG